MDTYDLNRLAELMQSVVEWHSRNYRFEILAVTVARNIEGERDVPVARISRDADGNLMLRQVS